MACEYSAINIQNVLSNQPVVFTESPVPCTRGFIFHRDGSGSFLVASRANQQNCGCGCGCNRIYETQYQVEFHANVSVPTGGTVEEIQLAIAIDGEIDPSSIMRITPAAVDEYGNIGTSVIVGVPSLCRCSSLSIRNISTQAVNVQNANVVIEPQGIRRVL